MADVAGKKGKSMGAKERFITASWETPMAISREILRIVALAASLIVFISPVSAQTPEFVVGVGELKRLDPESGEARWAIHHASAWETLKRERQWCDLLGPIEVEQGWFYTFCGDLLRFDPATGTIEERTEFPAKIVEFDKVDESTLRLTVDLDGDETRVPTVELTYRPGESPPPRARWAFLPTLAVWKEVTNLHPLVEKLPFIYRQEGGDQRVAAGDADHRAAIAAIEARRGQEPGNPFYDFFAAAHYEQLGDDEEADRLYAIAAANDEGSWWTDANLATLLESAGQPQRATSVWKHAMEKLDARFPTFRQHSSLVAQAFYWGIWGNDPLREAVDRGDVEVVDRVNARLFAVAPHVEAGAMNWRVLADWFADRGHPELAEKWRANAEIADASPWGSVVIKRSRELDFVLLFLVALLIAMPLAAWFSGVRAPSSERIAWLPRPRVRDLVGLAILILVTVGATWKMNTTLREIAFRADVPITAETGAWGSPDVADWLENLEPSTERDELIEYSRAVTAAVTAGVKPPTRDDGHELLAVAIEKDARSSWDVEEASWGPGMPVTNPFSAKPWLLLPWLLFLGFLIVGGHVLGRFVPRATRFVSYAIPGCAAPAGPIGGVMTALFAASVLALATPLDEIFSTIALPPFRKYFGLENVWPPLDFFISTRWAWVSLVVVLVAHVATVLLDMRSRLRESRTSIHSIRTDSFIVLGVVWLVAAIALGLTITSTYDQQTEVRSATSETQRKAERVEMEARYLEENPERVVDAARRARENLQLCRKRKAAREEGEELPVAPDDGEATVEDGATTDAGAEEER